MSRLRSGRVGALLWKHRRLLVFCGVVAVIGAVLGGLYRQTATVYSFDIGTMFLGLPILLAIVVLAAALLGVGLKRRDGASAAAGLLLVPMVVVGYWLGPDNPHGQHEVSGHMTIVSPYSAKGTWSVPATCQIDTASGLAVLVESSVTVDGRQYGIQVEPGGSQSRWGDPPSNLALEHPDDGAEDPDPQVSVAVGQDIGGLYEWDGSPDRSYSMTSRMLSGEVLTDPFTTFGEFGPSPSAQPGSLRLRVSWLCEGG